MRPAGYNRSNLFHQGVPYLSTPSIDVNRKLPFFGVSCYYKKQDYSYNNKGMYSRYNHIIAPATDGAIYIGNK